MPTQTFPGSSALSSASYDPERQDLTITFKGGRSYTYPRVSLDVWEGLLEASSPGTFWREQIKDRF